MWPTVGRAGGACVRYRLVPALLGSLWLVGWGGVAVEGAVFWTDLTLSGDKPDGRHGHAMAYDTARGQVVLFGGDDGNGNLLQDTWVWDGATQVWTDVTPAGNKPSSRWGAIMVYDIARGQMILFGGWNGSTVLGDTWKWDGTAWTELHPASAPIARYFHAMAYDRVQRVVLLFGGEDRGNPTTFFQDTWEWDGTTWTNRTPTPVPPDPPYESPSARSWHSMAYDAVRDQTVMFGGWDGSMLLGDTWVWNGASKTWTALSPASSPGARCEQTMVYDPVRERVVLFGGLNMERALGDSWEWNGSTWTDVTPATGPQARHTHAMIYEAARDRVVLFGGRDRNIPAMFQDTWGYDDDTSVRQGYWTIDACRDGITQEPCYWHYRYDRNRCTPAQPCSKLVVFFSTGKMTCDEPEAFTATDGKGKILQAYAVGDPTPGDGYVAVCANLFLTEDGSGKLPFNAEAGRVDQLILNITDASSPQSSLIRSVWNGRHLLWSGVSHGASATVIAMGRTNLDEQNWWKGSVYTAACFYDGVYDMLYADLFWAANNCVGLHRRNINKRYYGQDTFLAHSCTNDKCGCDPDHSLEMDEDTLVDTPGDGLTPSPFFPPPAPLEYAIADWKLIECGSHPLLGRCADDIFPKEPIQELCTQVLDPHPERTCVFQAFPLQSHNICAQTTSGIEACRDWFTDKVQQLP